MFQVTMNGSVLEENTDYIVNGSTVNFLNSPIANRDVIAVNGVEVNFNGSPNHGTVTIATEQPIPEFPGFIDSSTNFDVNLRPSSFDNISVGYNTIADTAWINNIPGPKDRAEIHIIAAIGDNNQMSLDNKLPWHYEEDLELFKDAIKNKVAIMGRVTFETLPEDIKKNSDIIVVSKTLENHDYIVDSLEDALSMVEDWDESEAWICGGQKIYEEAISKELVDKLHISHIPYTGKADRYFPNFSKYIYSIEHGTTIESKDNKKPFVFKTYRMKAPESNIVNGTSHVLNDSIVTTASTFANLRGVTADAVYLDEVAHQDGTLTASTLGIDTGASLTATDMQEAMDEIQSHGMTPNRMLVHPETMNQFTRVASPIYTMGVSEPVGFAGTSGITMIETPEVPEDVGVGSIWIDRDTNETKIIDSQGNVLTVESNTTIERRSA